MATGRVPTTANSPLTAKGDLFGYSTAPARLAVGNNGETLVADSSTSTGLRYTAGTVSDNPVINSAFQVWQRGTSFAVPAGGTNNYTADRWVGYRAATGMTISRQVTGDTTNLPNIQYCARISRDSGNTATNNLQLGNIFETVNTIPFAGKTVTISFYARKGANFSATSNALTLIALTGTGTDQNPISGFTGASQSIAGGATLTSTWQRFSVTGTLPSTMTQIYLQFYYDPTGTAGAADYYELTGVQIDVGSVALPFRTNGATIQGELAACQRYYYRLTPGAGKNLSFGANYQTTENRTTTMYPVEMRIAPTALEQNGTANNYAIAQAGIGVTVCNSVPTFSSATTRFALSTGFVASGLTSYNPSTINADATNGATAYLGWSAEL
jgi:hypothetical protein